MKFVCACFFSIDVYSFSSTMPQAPNIIAMIHISSTYNVMCALKYTQIVHVIINNMENCFALSFVPSFAP